MTPQRTLLRRDPAEVEAARRAIEQRCKAAQLKGQDDLFWQQFAMGETLADPAMPIDRGLASSIGELWLCGIVERLPETEQELHDLLAQLRQAGGAASPARGEGDRRGQ